jgi:hypothetical protein
MNLPIPHILSHSIVSLDAKGKETFALFEAIVGSLESGLKQEMILNPAVTLEFPQIVASYLQASLQRVRVTAWGVISAVNAPNEVLFALAVRALLESSANLAYVRANLYKTYASELPREEMTYLSFRMKFATRKPDDMNLTVEEASRVSSVNILTAIKALDRFAADNLDFASEKPMTRWYERLCEFAHPNSLGNSIGSELDFLARIESFDIDPLVRPGVLAQFGIYAYVSIYSFCLIHNDCWRMLSDAKETLPTWTPAGDPLILLEG